MIFDTFFSDDDISNGVILRIIDVNVIALSLNGEQIMEHEGEVMNFVDIIVEVIKAAFNKVHEERASLEHLSRDICVHLESE